MYRKTYFLPNKLRKDLRKIWGIPIFNGREKVTRKFKKLIQEKKFKKIITVGDYCSLTLSSDVKIFDGKIKRKTIKKLPKFSLSCRNPAGTIQKEVWSVLKKAIENNENVFVDGEEDLLVIPSVLLSKKNTAVVYGFPERGVCLIEVFSQTKKDFKELLQKFETKQPS